MVCHAMRRPVAQQPSRTRARRSRFSSRVSPLSALLTAGVGIFLQFWRGHEQRQAGKIGSRGEAAA